MERDILNASLFPIWGIILLVLKVTGEGGGCAGEEGRDDKPCKEFPLHHSMGKNLTLLVPMVIGTVSVQDKTESAVQNEKIFQVNIQAVCTSYGSVFIPW